MFSFFVVVTVCAGLCVWHPHQASISACEKASQWQVALYLMTQLGTKHIQADVVSYNSSISACQNLDSSVSGQIWSDFKQNLNLKTLRIQLQSSICKIVMFRWKIPGYSYLLMSFMACGCLAHLSAEHLEGRGTCENYPTHYIIYTHKSTRIHKYTYQYTAYCINVIWCIHIIYAPTIWYICFLVYLHEQKERERGGCMQDSLKDLAEPHLILKLSWPLQS